jgi:hypothetical protein
MSNTTELTKELRHGVPVKLGPDGRVVEFWIRRENWHRGNGPTGSRLVREDGAMCCLGHYETACNIPQYELLNVGTPMVVNTVNQEVKWLSMRTGLSYRCASMIEANDNGGILDTERENLICEDFAKHGITVHFCDGIPPEFKELENA